MVKQVIVVRKDLGMRKGKAITQACHASMMWLSLAVRENLEEAKLHDEPAKNISYHITDEQVQWIEQCFIKICVGVDSEQELMEIYEKAQKAGLTIHLVTDSGKTEFNGVPTRTCLAVGPNEASKIDEVTGHLKLL